MIETACRGSEIAGLTLSDFDLRKRLVSINHQLLHKYINDYDEKCSYHITSPKTKLSVRKIPLSKTAINAVAMRVDYIDIYLKRIVGSYNVNEMDKAFKENREPELLPKITAHMLRHTGCTRMAESGMDIRTLQTIMGHNDVSLMQVYNHVDDQRLLREIEKLDNMKSELISYDMAQVL